MPRTIGFIGLGLMGTGFTKRLAATGHRVVGYDVDPGKREAARAWGVEEAGSPAEAAAEADVACICVTTSHAVEEVVIGAHGLTSIGLLDGRTVVDFSTTEMAVTHGGRGAGAGGAGVAGCARPRAAGGGRFPDSPLSWVFLCFRYFSFFFF